MGLRQNIYELVDYLIENDIVHFIAHPFFDVDGKLDADKVEKMLLLFKVVEVISGTRSRKFVDPLERIIPSLNKDKIERLADRHNLEPRGKLPWVKAMIGGSDDHSGFFIARAYTISRKGANPAEFVSSINSAEVWPGGEHGDPLTLAHSLYGIAYRFFKNRVDSGKKGKQTFLHTIGQRFFDLAPRKLGPQSQDTPLPQEELPLQRRRQGRSFSRRAARQRGDEPPLRQKVHGEPELPGQKQKDLHRHKRPRKPGPVHLHPAPDQDVRIDRPLRDHQLNQLDRSRPSPCCAVLRRLHGPALGERTAR